MLKGSIKRVGLLILFRLDPCCEAIGVGRRFTLADLDPMSLAPIADKACDFALDSESSWVLSKHAQVIG